VNLPIFRYPRTWLGPRCKPHTASSFSHICQGTHWNFAAKQQEGANPLAYIYAVTPALLLFAVMVFAPTLVHLALLTGFPMLLSVDRYFVTKGVTPSWWMNLRLWLSGIVTLSLLITYSVI
jgi:hypothetical protein